MWDYFIGILIFLSAYKHLNLFLIKRRLRRKEKMQIMQGAEPFFLQGGKTGVLLIHGFTATPHEMKELGKYLHKRGMTVYAPLLSGHGTVPERLVAVKGESWINDTKKALAVLEGTCTKIFIIGNSFGGNLALLAGYQHKKVKALVVLATPFLFKHERVRHPILLLMKQVKLFKRKRYPKKVKEAYQKVKRISYDQIPLYGLLQVLHVVKKSRDLLPSVTKPILLMQSTDDNVISEESVDYVIKRLGSRIKKVIYIPNSIHVFITDKKRMIAFKQILAFLRKI
jgi:carboxylesterase